MKGQYKNLRLDAGLITQPLKAFLSQPDKNILQRLAVLETRYARYRAGSDIARGREFNVDTGFLSLINDQSAVAIARQLSEDALRGFRQISLDSVIMNDDNIRSLGSQWDRLCYDVQEVAAVGDLIGRVRAMAKVS